MNRVAVITDIHANLPALEATLCRIEDLAVDAVYCGGDLVGYGPHPNEVCALIEARDIPTIYGNYDYAIGRDLETVAAQWSQLRLHMFTIPQPLAPRAGHTLRPDRTGLRRPRKETRGES